MVLPNWLLKIFYVKSCLSESDLGPQESTTECESDAKPKSEPNSDPMAHLMSAGNKRKAKNKPRKKKKMFKPLI